MRISGGDARGIRLKVPKGARAATERVRHAVFSSLATEVLDARVLDLYCGSGSYALEALSRGATDAVLVDRDRRALEAARANARGAGAGGRTSFRRRNVDGYLGSQAGDDGPFDLVFVDPPYGNPEIVPRVLRGLRDALVPSGRVVFETRWREEPPSSCEGFVLEADRRYGDTRVRVYVRTDSQEG